MTNMRNVFGQLLLATLVVFAATWEAAAQVPGKLTVNNREFVGMVRWKAASREYSVMDPRTNIESIHPYASVQKMQIARPKELDPAIAAVRAKNGALAIPALTKIVNDYTMLQHDEEAARWLGEAYMLNNNAAEARKVIEKVIALRPQAAYLGDLATVYWRVLLQENRTAKLEELLSQAVKSGDRPASAAALIMRGDLILRAGDTQEAHTKALKDGYLRVVTLYRAVRALQPEANYKAAKSFEKLGMTQRAQDRRDLIRKEFPGSEWANKP